MRMGCSCGAWIKARRSDALAWEQRHRCPDRPELDGDIHVATGAQVENAARHEWDGMEARIGFQRN